MMPKLLVLHTNQGGHRFDETDIQQFLHDAYFTADLTEPADADLDFTFDASDWPDELKLSLMYAAQLSWFPGDGQEPTSWSSTPPGKQSALNLFNDFPGLTQAISGDTAPLLSRWTSAAIPAIPGLFDNHGPDRFASMVLQEIIQSRGDPETGPDPLTYCQDPPLPHQRARIIAPSLDAALASTLEGHRFPDHLYHHLMDHMEDLARDAAAKVPDEEQRLLLTAALEHGRLTA